MIFNLFKRNHSIGFETGTFDGFPDDSVESEILDKKHFRRNYKIINHSNYKIEEVRNVYSYVHVKLKLFENLFMNMSLSYISEESKHTYLFFINTNKKYNFPVFYRNYNCPGFMDLIILLDNIYYGIRISKSDNPTVRYLNKPFKRIQLSDSDEYIYISNLYKINYDGIYPDDAYKDFKIENVV